MSKKETLQLFESKKVRSVWDSDAEKWYISIVDVIEVLTESDNPQVYWRVLKKRLLDEGNEEAVLKARQPLFLVKKFGSLHRN